MMKQKNIKFTLRPSLAEDVDFLFNLRVKTMKSIFEGAFGWNDAEERAKAAEALTHARIVMYGHMKIGAIKLIPRTDELHLHQLQILPDFQGQGVGAELLRQTIVQSEKWQKPITLFVVKNTPAIRLYERFGFIVTDEYEHNCRMCRPPC